MPATPGPHQGHRRGYRDNGLAAEHFAVLADLDPRVAESLLRDLAEAGIAGYLAPSPGERGGYLETRLPAKPTDRLWVDARALAGARLLLEAELRAHPPEGADEETQWAAIVAGYGEGAATPVPPWPVSEDLDSPPTVSARVVRPAAEDFIGEPLHLDEEEHFVPPPPPPLPRPRVTTVAALVLIAGAVALVAVPSLRGGGIDRGTAVLAVAAFLGGCGLLVYHLRDERPDRDDDDDGAVV